MSLKSRNKVNPAFNMSSMTDLVFLLLIFFMILTTMVKSNNILSVSLPGSGSQEKSTAKVRVSVDANMNYYIDKDPVTIENLSAALNQKLAGVEDAKVELAVDESVPHKYFVQLADIISVQNKYKMVLVTKPMK